MAKPWNVLEAEKILQKIPNDCDTVIFQTGFGPSGLPHIGTFGEVSRTTFVRKAFQEISDKKTILYAFCDDMDGLRKVPQNMPNKEMLTKHLGKPLVHVPDPYECCESFAHHMEDKLKTFLNNYGFNYEFKSSQEEYKSGRFNQGLENTLKNVEKIRNIIIPTMRKEDRHEWSPFMPICTQCGKNLTTKVTDYHPESNEISYSCEFDINENIKGCLHKERVNILNGTVKLGWKADWALRWYSYGINYEMYGKDLIESFNLSKKIVKVLGGFAPIDFFYELFLNEEGSKISKSVGKGLTVDTWLDYAPIESLSYFMYQNPKKAKRFYFDIIPKVVDEYLTFLRNYYNSDSEAKKNNPVYFIKDKADNKIIFNTDISYSLINNLISALGKDDPEIVFDYIKTYDAGAVEYKDFIMELVKKALTYYRDHILPNKKFKSPNVQEKTLLEILIDKLGSEVNNEADAYQTNIFNTAKENDTPPKQFFKLIYEVYFGQESGPKLGSFIKLIGKDDFVKQLKLKLT